MAARRGDVEETHLPRKIEAHTQVRIRVGVGAPARAGAPRPGSGHRWDGRDRPFHPLNVADWGMSMRGTVAPEAPPPYTPRVRPAAPRHQPRGPRPRRACSPRRSGPRRGRATRTACVRTPAYWSDRSSRRPWSQPRGITRWAPPRPTRHADRPRTPLCWTPHVSPPFWATTRVPRGRRTDVPMPQAVADLLTRTTCLQRLERMKVRQ